MSATNIHDIAVTATIEERSTRRTVRLIWRIVLIGALSASGLSFATGSVISLLVALEIVLATTVTAYLTMGFLFAAFGFAFLAAHAMDKISVFRMQDPK